MDIQTIALYVGALMIALFLLKFVIKVPFLLLRYGLLAVLAYAAYLFFSGRM